MQIVVDGNDMKLLEVKYALEDCVKRENLDALLNMKMEVEPIAMLTELREGNKRPARMSSHQH